MNTFVTFDSIKCSLKYIIVQYILIDKPGGRYCFTEETEKTIWTADVLIAKTIPLLMGDNDGSMWLWEIGNSRHLLYLSKSSKSQIKFWP